MADFIEVSGKLDQLISQVKRGLNAELKYYTSELGEPMPPEPYVDAPVFEEYDEERLLEELETGDIVELVEQRQKAAGKLLTQLDTTVKDAKAKLMQVLEDMKNDNTNQELDRLDYWLQFVEKNNRDQGTTNNNSNTANNGQEEVPVRPSQRSAHINNHSSDVYTSFDYQNNNNNDMDNFSTFSSIRSPIDTTPAPDSPTSPMSAARSNNTNNNSNNNNVNQRNDDEESDDRYNANIPPASSYSEDEVAVDSPFRAAHRSTSAPPNTTPSHFLVHKRSTSPGPSRPNQQQPHLSSSKGNASPFTSRSRSSQSTHKQQNSSHQPHQFANTLGRDYFPEKESWKSTGQYFKQAHKTSTNTATTTATPKSTSTTTASATKTTTPTTNITTPSSTSKVLRPKNNPHRLHPEQLQAAI